MNFRAEEALKNSKSETDVMLMGPFSLDRIGSTEMPQG